MASIYEVIAYDERLKKVFSKTYYYLNNSMIYNIKSRLSKYYKALTIVVLKDYSIVRIIK